MFTIEKNVPLPSKATKTGFSATLREMAVGDSVHVPSEKVNSCRQLAYQMHNRSKSRFTLRTLEDGSIRLWRIK